MRLSKESAAIKSLLLKYPTAINAIRYDRHRRLLWIVTTSYSESILRGVADFVRQHLSKENVSYSCEFVPMVTIEEVACDPRPSLRKVQIPANELFDLD